MTGEGVVVAFDFDAGLGTIAPADGSAALPFHCVSLADGSRTVEADAAVHYRRVGGVGGRWEAADIVTVAAPRSSPLG